MVKRKQTQSSSDRNRQYSIFVKAFKEDNQNIMEEGYNKGFRISNNIFISQLAKEINNVLNRYMVRTIRFTNFKYLDPENINVIEDGYTLLDNIVRLFSDAINIEEGSGKEYFINVYKYFVEKLISLGAVLNQEPVYPNFEGLSTDFLGKVVAIINILNSVNPYYQEDTSSEDTSSEDMLY